jgi:hypothetical protein
VETNPIPPRYLSAVDELAGLVLGYLRDHPDAADTLQGVAEWWIPRQQIRVDVMNLQRALRLLVVRGLVQEVGKAEDLTYRLAPPSHGADRAQAGPEPAGDDGHARREAADGVAD